MSEELVAEYRENIRKAWDACTPDQIARGLSWYEDAHNLAWVIGRGDFFKGAGLLAALSPQKDWNVNRRLAIDASQGDIHGHVTDAVNKAKRILGGEDPFTVLPKGKKTWHFYGNIAFPQSEKYVTIDRHAYRVATCEWDNGSPVIKASRYALIAMAYQLEASSIGVLPLHIQAATWGYARERS